MGQWQEARPGLIGTWSTKPRRLDLIIEALVPLKDLRQQSNIVSYVQRIYQYGVGSERHKADCCLQEVCNHAI